MAKKVSTNLDLLLNELQNAKIHIVASDPSSPAEGQIYYNSTTKALKFYNGTAWVTLGNLNQMTATGAVSVNNQLISSVATPISASDAATKGYVDSMAQGLDAKLSVVAATTTQITLSAPQTVDGIAVVAGDRVLVRAQTAPAENGIYVVAAGAWVRSTDTDVWTELPGAFTFVEKGTTYADTGWLCSVDAGGTLGTTAITWTQFSSAGLITASNLAGAGAVNASIFSAKVGSDLRFKQVSTPTGSGVSITANTNDVGFDVNTTNLHDTKKFSKYVKLTFAYVSAGTDIALTHNLALTDFDAVDIVIFETTSKASVEVDRSSTASTTNIAYIKMYGGTTGAGFYTAVIMG